MGNSVKHMPEGVRLDKNFSKLQAEENSCPPELPRAHILYYFTNKTNTYLFHYTKHTNLGPNDRIIYMLIKRGGG